MSDDPLIGRQLANFRLERILGRGGMGQVYYGRDVKLNRPVAVKVIDFRFRNNPAYAKRFVREAQAVATWRHENIAQVYYADEQDELYYFAMEYIDGLDLGQILSQYAAKGELMPQADVLRIGGAIANALDYAHARDVIHRDVKPSNVIVAQEGRVVLTDFGLALDTQQGSVGEVFGTAHYIAPEQARRSSEAIPQSDLYSLGIMLYEMLTGMVPFDDPSPTSVALLHIMQPPPAPRSLNPKLNDETEAVLLKALSKSPQDRYQTGQALMAALDSAFQSSDAPVAPAPLPPLPAGMQFQSQPAIPQIITTESAASQPPIVGAPAATPSLAKSPTPKPPSTERPSAQPPRRSVSRIALGGCFLALIAVVVLAGLLFASPLVNLLHIGAPPKDTPEATLVSQASSTEIQSTQLPSDLTKTAQPSGESTTQTASPILGSPTVKYPNGKRFLTFYDNNSLYFLNLSKSDVPINWVAFERLSDSGASLNRFNGSRWGQFYATSTPSWCMAIEILNSEPYLDPPDCGHDNLYLSLRTPIRNDPTVFWTTQEGSHQFRVLWREGGKDEEVARCEIGAGTCEVFLP